MSALVDKTILECIDSGAIVIRPFAREHLGTNSYDVTLGPLLRTYAASDQPLCVREQRAVVDVPIPPEGFVLQPGELYLASTIEYTESNEHLPILNGKSSLGRLGLSIHVTAGTGDVLYKGHWTLEMTVVKSLRVYAGMPVGQLLWFEVSDTPLVGYAHKASAKYRDIADPLPQSSRMWRNFEK